MSFDGEQQQQKDNLKKTVAIGLVWTIISRWGVRLLGLVSTLVLARILAPEDFGLIAMASAIAAILTSFAEMGLNLALISLPKVENKHFNTAWTISIIVGTTISLLIVISSPFAADYYNEARVEFILYWLALANLLDHSTNPKLALFLREFKYNKDFYYTTSCKILSVTVTIIAAVILQDYRAFLVAAVARGTISSTLSYCMLPYLPRFDLSARREILSYSIWLTIRNFGFTAMSRIEQFAIGPFFTPAKLSYYYMGSEIGNMLTGELGLPLGRALLPGYAVAQNDPERLLRGLRLSFAAILLVLPFAFGLAALAPEFIQLVLGDKWLPAAPLLSLLSIAGALAVLRAPFSPLFLATGKIKHIAIIAVIFAIILGISAFFLAPLQSLIIIAWLQIAIKLLILIASLLLARKVCPMNIREFLFFSARPLAASIIMYFAVANGQAVLQLSPLAALFFWPVIGAILFFMALSAIWLLCRKPFGLEELILSYGRQLAVKLRQKLAR